MPERWVHCDVGGHPDARLADTVLLWTVDRAQRKGPAVRDDAVARSAPEHPDAHLPSTPRTTQVPVDPPPVGLRRAAS